MKRKLLFSALFAFAVCTLMLLLCLGIGAQATVSDAASLQEALASAESGDVITLDADFTVSQTLTVGTAVTIDGNGHTISTTASKAFMISADLTLRNVNLSGNGSSRLLNVPAGASPTLTVSGSSAPLLPSPLS